PALNLVGQSRCRQEITTADVGVLRRCQNSTEVITGVAGFSFCKITVVEIEITNQSAIEECRSTRCCFTATDQRTLSPAAKIFDLVINGPDEFVLKRPECATQCVEQTSLQRSHSKTGHICERSVHDKVRKLLDLCHVVSGSNHQTLYHFSV